MVSTESFKKFNFINEKLGFSVSWGALRQLNLHYEKYLQLGDLAPKNIVTGDFHCGVTNENNDNNNDGYVLIDKLRYHNRSKNPNGQQQYIRDMNDDELLNIRIPHCCDPDTKKTLILPTSSHCGKRIIETSSAAAFINNKIYFDVEDHPVNSIVGTKLIECGFVYCFKVPFEKFICHIAAMNNVDLSAVENWKTYQSPINPYKSTKFVFCKKNKTISIKKSNVLDVNVQSDILMEQIHGQQVESDQMSMDNIDQGIIMDNTEQDDVKMFENMDWKLDESIIEHAHIEPQPKLGKVKTEKLIVDCFRKELIPFIDCTWSNELIKEKVMLVCQKYFFRFDQAIKHKGALNVMRKQDPTLSYFANIQLPSTLLFNVIQDNENDNEIITPIKIVKNWIDSCKSNPLEPPFEANDLLKYIRNDFAEENDHNEQHNNIECNAQPICMSVTDLIQ